MQEGSVTPSEAKLKAKARKLRDTLALFPVMPNEALVDLDFVGAFYSRSPASIWRDVKAGRIAQPVKAGPRCTRWTVGSLRSPI